MISVSSRVRIWLATSLNDKRREMNALALQFQKNFPARSPGQPIRQTETTLYVAWTRFPLTPERCI